MPALSPRTALDTIAADHRLRGFVRDGRIENMPARRSRRLLVLDVVAQVFEPGVRYAEPEVNRLLADMHPDYAALRRYLVDEELMERAAGEYWRIGGPVPTEG
jgi:hypothetical protein